MIDHAKHHLARAGIGSESAQYRTVMQMLETLAAQTTDLGEQAKIANLVGRLVRLENLPVAEAAEWKHKIPGDLLPWQKALIERMPPETFCELPSYMAEQSSMWKLATYEAFLSDTIDCHGTQMAVGLSLAFKPKVVVEFGVHAGFTTLLFCRMNPEARVYAVDSAARAVGTMLPTCCVPMMHQVQNLTIAIMDSAEFRMPGQVDLCFVDADHGGEAPLRDSWRAWENRNTAGDWCIAWDDYHEDNPDVVRAVDTICLETNEELKRVGSWVWIGTKSEAELRQVMGT